MLSLLCRFNSRAHYFLCIPYTSLYTSLDAQYWLLCDHQRHDGDDPERSSNTNARNIVVHRMLTSSTNQSNDLTNQTRARTKITIGMMWYHGIAVWTTAHSCDRLSAVASEKSFSIASKCRWVYTQASACCDVYIYNQIIERVSLEIEFLNVRRHSRFMDFAWTRLYTGPDFWLRLQLA